MFALLFYTMAHVNGAAPTCTLKRLAPFVIESYCPNAARLNNDYEGADHKQGQWYCVQSTEWKPVTTN
jgi:hypothetical protein